MASSDASLFTIFSVLPKENETRRDTDKEDETMRDTDRENETKRYRE